MLRGQKATRGCSAMGPSKDDLRWDRPVAGGEDGECIVAINCELGTAHECANLITCLFAD